jgi:hypothetical protein
MGYSNSWNSQGFSICDWIVFPFISFGKILNILLNGMAEDNLVYLSLD